MEMAILFKDRAETCAHCGVSAKARLRSSDIVIRAFRHGLGAVAVSIEEG
jgi:hypothetical protein